MKEELLKLMKETKMNQSTITGVMKLATDNKTILLLIQYIMENKEIITNHQLRQYLAEILLEM